MNAPTTSRTLELASRQKLQQLADKANRLEAMIDAACDAEDYETAARLTAEQEKLTAFRRAVRVAHEQVWG
jgi:hypothetical protein